MSRMNNQQVGGSHYRGHTDYQHWDWAIESCIGILEYGASRYVIRIKKDPIEDLKKAAHFIEKIQYEHSRGNYISTFAIMIRRGGEEFAKHRVSSAYQKLMRAYYPDDPTNWRPTWCALLSQWTKPQHLLALHEELLANIRAGSIIT